MNFFVAFIIDFILLEIFTSLFPSPWEYDDTEYTDA